MSASHRILRQFIEVSVFGPERLGSDVQQVVGAWCNESLADELERALATYDRDERYHLVDRLELDLGTVRLEELEEALTAAVTQRLRADLGLLLSAPRDEGGMRSPTDARVAARHRTDPLPPDRTTLHPSEAFLQAFLHHLRHGRLPWWYAPERSTTLESLLMDTLHGQPIDGAPDVHDTLDRLVAGVTDVLRASLVARRRLLLQFSAGAVLALLQALSPRLRDAIAGSITTIGGSGIPQGLHERLAGGVAEAAIDVAAGLSTATDASNVTSAHLLLTALFSERAAIPAPDVPVLLEACHLDRASVAATARPDIARQDQSPSASTAEASPDDADVFTSEGLLAPNAGVVLLHPFLSQFLHATRVAANGALVDLPRALLLIHHLATGAREADEFELLFPKILCGVPVELPVERALPVTDAERAETEALLQTVIRYWDALRNTTVDGLRGNFLVREGRVDRLDHEWLLRMESRSYDVLLDRLPWGIGHVQLPWMHRLMRVEWSR